MVLYLLELSQLPHHCSIAELHSPIELILKSSLVPGLSLLHPLLSPAVVKVDGYALTNQPLHNDACYI